MDINVIGITLTVSSIFSGASAFFLGFLLSERVRGDPAKVAIYKKLIIVMSVPTILLGLGGLYQILSVVTPMGDQVLLLLSVGGSIMVQITFLITATK